MNKKVMKHSLICFSSAIVFSSVAPVLTSAETPATSRITQPQVGQLTSQEVSMFLNNGAPYTDRSKSNGKMTTQNIVTSLAKKLAVKALRKSGAYLEKPLSKVIGKKYAKKATKSFHKIADYLETVQNVQEHGIAAILIKGGLPADVALDTAKWMVLFFGF